MTLLSDSASPIRSGALLLTGYRSFRGKVTGFLHLKVGRTGRIQADAGETLAPPKPVLLLILEHAEPSLAVRPELLFEAGILLTEHDDALVEEGHRGHRHGVPCALRGEADHDHVVLVRVGSDL